MSIGGKLSSSEQQKRRQVDVSDPTRKSSNCQREPLSFECDTKAIENIRRALEVIKQVGQPPLDRALRNDLDAFESMFPFERIARPFGWRHFLLVLYAPVGVLLVVVRLALMVLSALVLPVVLNAKQFERAHRFFCCITGTVVRVEDAELWDDTSFPDIIVANHISEFDAIGIRWLTPAYVLGYDVYKSMMLFRLLGDKFGLLFVPSKSRSQGNNSGRDEIRQIILEKLREADKPIVCFPEGGLTNGKHGLLQYHKFLFSLGKSIQPLAIQVSVPFPVNHNDETSTFLANFLWYLFMPYHLYTLRCLPRTILQPHEDALAFAQRVMKTTAQALNQQATPFLYRDKAVYRDYKVVQLQRSRQCAW